MKVKDILQKARAVLEAANEFLPMFGVVVPAPVLATVAIAERFVDRFSMDDPEKDYTQEEINAEADAAIAGIHERDKDFVKDEPDNS